MICSDIWNEGARVGMAQDSSKKVGLLTSGGDCAGLNAVIRAVVHRADRLGWDVLGIQNGSHGLFSDPPDCVLLEKTRFDGTIMRQGGTILGTTNKGNPFAYPMPDGSIKDRSDEIVRGFHQCGLEALIGIGGDGSLAILNDLAKKGDINFVGIPKTIDNDVALTESCIGFDTAVSVATTALDNLQPTAASHSRIMILEVMGRDAGHIALRAGIAGGVDVILIPEIACDIQKVATKIQEVQDNGRNYALIVVSEAVKLPDGKTSQITHSDGEARYGGIGSYLAAELSELTGSEARVTVLGHVQRGAPPSPDDRVLASAFGVKAMDLVHEGRFGRMVAWKDREVVDVDINDVTKGSRVVDLCDTLVDAARGLGISFGD